MSYCDVLLFTGLFVLLPRAKAIDAMLRGSGV